MKFNCFFLMPFIDEFPFYLRSELDRVYEGDMAHLFDISELKASLNRRREDLLAECQANERLQGKFDVIDAQMRASVTALEKGGLRDDDEDEEDEEANYGYYRGGTVEVTTEPEEDQYDSIPATRDVPPSAPGGGSSGGGLGGPIKPTEPSRFSFGSFMKTETPAPATRPTTSSSRDSWSSPPPPPPPTSRGAPPRNEWGTSSPSPPPPSRSVPSRDDWTSPPPQSPPSRAAPPRDEWSSPPPPTSRSAPPASRSDMEGTPSR